jgi:hypothetical protein
MIDFVTFLWNGDRWRPSDQGEEYVNVLYSAVRRFKKPPFNFTVFQKGADVEKLKGPMTILPLKSPSWVGCIPKLTVFNPCFQFYDRVVVLDLDTIITGDLEDICAVEDEFITRGERQRDGSYLSGGDLLSFRNNSKITTLLWREISTNWKEIEGMCLRGTPGGSERAFYRKHVKDMSYWQAILPGQLVDYKAEIRTNNNELPKNARVISCHGHPRPKELLKTVPWVKQYWCK